MTPGDAQSIVGLFFPQLPPQSPNADNEVAGLSTVGRPELLTWERIYTLALVRARAGGTRRAEVLDPKALAETAARLGVDDYSRFRHDFLASRPGAGGAFRDPSGDYLELLRQRQVIDNARIDLGLREKLLRLYRELVQGESSGLSSLEIDLVEDSLVGARQRLANTTTHFRDGLDELKAALGLPALALFIPDPQGIAAFRESF
jgi:hypothetical protein